MIYNVNIGILGHVDSGKTSLCKKLSTVASTAAFDKHPQSKERGITLDLGFSSFLIGGCPDHLKDQSYDYSAIQYTLVDCPGHASLIRTIIGGAQIIDLMILVIDIVKGVQTQTAECLVIGEITCERMIIVLNKVDLIPVEKRESTIDRMKKRLLKTVENTKFANSPIVVVSANPGDVEDVSSNSGSNGIQGVQELMTCIYRMTPSPKECRTLNNAPLLLAVDHCFAIRGQGTVMTGTVLSGSLRVGDTVELPSCKISKKVKSMQIFRKPVESASQGDRVGVCVTQFDSELMERGIVCSPPGYMQLCHAAIIDAKRIPHFRGSINSKSKMHITIGHETVMANLTLFKIPSLMEGKLEPGKDDIWNEEYLYLDQWPEEERNYHSLMLLEFEKPVLCPFHEASPPEMSKFSTMAPMFVIGSRLDSDIHANVCRLAFHGRLLLSMKDSNYRHNILPKLKVFRLKSRSGLIDRIPNPNEAIVKQLFKKETNLQAFNGLNVKLEIKNDVDEGDVGQVTIVKGFIEGSFGQSGKCKIRFPDDIPDFIVRRYCPKKGKNVESSGVDEAAQKSESVQVILEFKRFLFDPHKRMIQ